jgi:hypothetical protein
MILTKAMHAAGNILAMLAFYYFFFCNSPDKYSLFLLAAIASIGLHCLYNAEMAIYTLVSCIQNSDNIEQTLQKNDE